MLGRLQHLRAARRRQRERATATAFEPGCLRMPKACTGVPFERATPVTSSKPSWTSATSPRRMAGPDLAHDDLAQRLRVRARGCGEEQAHDDHSTDRTMAHAGI